MVWRHLHHIVPLRLRSLTRRSKVEAELDEELAFHLEYRIQEGLNGGLSREEARYAALQSLSGLEQRKEECRDVRGTRWVEDLFRDLRYGLRTVKRNLGFAITAVLMLAFGIGINAVVFSIANAVAFRPLPVPDSGKVVRIHGVDERDLRRTTFSYPIYQAMHESPAGLEGLAAYSPYFSTTVARQGLSSESIHAFLVSENYFEVLRGTACVGRLLTSADARTRSVVLSHVFWRNRLAGDPDVIGSTLIVNRKPYVIIGVACPDFAGAELRQPLAWLPLSQHSDLSGASTSTEPDTSWTRWLFVVGRLSTGSEIDSAEAALSVIAARARQSPASGEAVRKVELRRATFFPVFSDMLPFASLLLIPSLLILLVACANLASVMLARGAARQREIAARASLGASRGRIVRQLMTEAALLSLVGGLAGVLTGSWLLEFISAELQRNVLQGQLARLDFSIDTTVLLFALLASVCTSVAFGLFPALALTRSDLMTISRSAAGIGTHTGRFRSQARLLATQIAICSVLLLTAALLLRSLTTALGTQPGFASENVLALRLDLRAAGYGAADGAVFLRAARQRLRAIPGVRSVASAQWTPLGDPDETAIELGGQVTASRYNRVCSEFFDAFQIPVIAGRSWNEAEAEAGAPVAVVSEAAARAWWPGKSPLGESVRTGSGNEAVWREVVGIVRDTRSIWLSRPDPSFVYLPSGGSGNHSAASTLIVRTDIDLGSLQKAAVNSLATLDPAVAAQAVRMRDLVQQWRLIPLAASVVASALGALGLMLAAVGLFGTTAYLVGQRTRELGVRRALGASSGDILRLVLGQGLRTVTVGAFFGLFTAALAASALAPSLYDLKALDPLAIAGVIAVLAGASLSAISVPARRAIRVDPAVALRHD